MRGWKLKDRLLEAEYRWLASKYRWLEIKVLVVGSLGGWKVARSQV